MNVKPDNLRRIIYPVRLPQYIVDFLKNHPTMKGPQLIETALIEVYKLSPTSDNQNDNPNQSKLPLDP